MVSQLRLDAFIGFVSIFLASPGICADEMSEEQIATALEDLRLSHIEANVPAPEKFDRLMERDLTDYFRTDTDSALTIKYELLRDGPTQSGISYPKYYVWVSVSAEGGQIRRGAARVAAIQRERFEVTHFIDEVDIRLQLSSLESMFPVQVANRIRTKMNIHTEGQFAP